MIKKILSCLFVCFVGTLTAQTVGQYELRKRTSAGMTPYGITLSNGQVIGQTAGIPAAITPLVSGDLSAYLTSATAATTYHPLTATSTGGNGAADSGKLVTYDASGQIFVTSTILVKHAVTAGLYSHLNPDSISFNQANGFDGEITVATLTANRTWQNPDKSGIYAMTSDLPTLNSLLPSQTGNSGKVLTTNGTDASWTASSSGLTIGTTTITSGTDGYILYNNAGTLGHLATTGSGSVVRAGGPTIASSITITGSSGYLYLSGAGSYIQAGGPSAPGLGIQAANHSLIFNGTNACAISVANTYTSSTNNELLGLTWSSNIGRVGTSKGSGGGSARDVALVRDSTIKFTVGANTNDHAQPAKLPSYIVSGLPSASTCGAGSCAFVTDATATTAYSTVAGGGSNKVLVISDGTNWIIH